MSGPDMGLAQLLLATVYFASYVFALGELAGSRGRAAAIGSGLVAAAAFMGLSKAWEAAVVMLAFVPVATGLFAFATWIFCKVISRASHPAAVSVREPLQDDAPDLPEAAPGRWRTRLRSPARVLD